MKLAVKCSAIITASAPKAKRLNGVFETLFFGVTGIKHAQSSAIPPEQGGYFNGRFAGKARVHVPSVKGNAMTKSFSISSDSLLMRKIRGRILMAELVEIDGHSLFIPGCSKRFMAFKGSGTTAGQSHIG